jgi:hypothetical protein
MMKMPFLGFIAWMILPITPSTTSAQDTAKPFVPIGIFIGKIEEGARIFTPVRLLPFDHPESEGHQFPNALQLYGTELNVLLWLGHQAGYELWATLTRYPMEPSREWKYPMFMQPESAGLGTLQPIRRPRADAPLKGLKAALFERGELVCFIVDTRDLTLAERGMKRASSMGLDMTRAEFLAGLDKVKASLGSKIIAAVVFSQ